MAVPRVYVRRRTTVWSVTHISHLTHSHLTHTGRTNIDFFIPLHNRPLKGQSRYTHLRVWQETVCKQCERQRTYGSLSGFSLSRPLPLRHIPLSLSCYIGPKASVIKIIPRLQSGATGILTLPLQPGAVERHPTAT